MRVRMLSHVAGTPSYHTGQIVDLEPRIAKAWIEDGLATPLSETEIVERATRDTSHVESR